MSCTCRKAVYLSEAEARQYARHMSRKGGPGTRDPYPCPGDPNLWHLTSKRRTKNKRRAREARRA